MTFPGLDPMSLMLLMSGASAGVGAASMMSKPKMPAAPAPMKMPDPIAPPKAPLSISDTAAGERARISGRSRSGGVSGLVLSPLGGSQGNGVQRTTLLGR